MTLDELIDGLKCPRCGHEQTFEAREVEEPITVGNDVVLVPLRAGVCSFCGERVFDTVAMAKIDAAIAQVRAGNVAALKHVGEVYRVPATSH
ncbi:MAG TPA: YgiT-type zinc finger protein [Ktedonobacterales bacterium]|jgi:YgiT-type zinc finger domain-containing protein